MEFNEALVKVLKHEGGYVDHPSDPGGETNYGITVAVARKNGYQGSMKDIPMDLVGSIYRKQYWDQVRADELPASLRFHIFDAAVNSGVSRAARWLQQTVGTTPDGAIGPVTLRAANAADPLTLASKYSGIRLQFLTSLTTFNTFGRGWVRRIADNLLEA